MDQGIIQALKAWYRKKLLAKLISSLDSGKEFSVNMLDALHFISAVWNEVTPTTLRNCFGKAGFNVFGDNCDVNDTDSASLVSEVEQQLCSLQQSGMAGLNDITPEEYINVDEEVTTAGELTNDEIVAQVQGHSSIEDDDDDDDDDTENNEPEITLSEAQICINKVRHFFGAKEGATSFFASIDSQIIFLDVKRALFKQSKITDYFVCKV